VKFKQGPVHAQKHNIQPTKKGGQRRKKLHASVYRTVVDETPSQRKTLTRGVPQHYRDSNSRLSSARLIFPEHPRGWGGRRYNLHERGLQGAVLAEEALEAHARASGVVALAAA